MELVPFRCLARARFPSGYPRGSGLCDAGSRQKMYDIPTFRPMLRRTNCHPGPHKGRPFQYTAPGAHDGRCGKEMGWRVSQRIDPTREGARKWRWSRAVASRTGAVMSVAAAAVRNQFP
jgi:hypothetical protein